VTNKKYDFVEEALSGRKKAQKYRQLVPVSDSNGVHVSVNGKELINFCSNDYLGLSAHPKLKSNAARFADKYGAGAGASRLVSGNLKIHEEIEDKIASVFESEAALVFNTGFQTNMSVLPTVADRHSLILADKKCHNSLIQGAQLSRADFKRFAHNDYEHLAALLDKAHKNRYQRIWIVSESLFSMDGDTCDTKMLLELATEYNAYLYIDEAHAIGVLGKNGLGLSFGQHEIDLKIGTFGKSFGSFGAFVLCSKQMKDYLINFCPGFIYTTALPPALLGAIDAALSLIPSMNAEREKLHNHIEQILQQLKAMGFNTGTGKSQIIPVIVGDAEKAVKLSKWLYDAGIWASAIRSPTVPKNEARIRLTITAKHTDEQVKNLLEAFKSWKLRQK